MIYCLILPVVGIEEKYEGHLKEEKDPVMGADLIVLDFDISLVHNQSRVETLILCHTFIGPNNNLNKLMM